MLRHVIKSAPLFLRGLSPDNMLELDRLIGADRPIAEVVDVLERIERRKAEMRLGLTNRSTQQEIIQKSVISIQVPPVSAQEPIITKQVAPHELSHEQLNRLLKEQAENLTNTFKVQIQALQDKIFQQSQPASRPEKQNLQFLLRIGNRFLIHMKVLTPLMIIKNILSKKLWERIINNQLGLIKY